MTRIALAVTAFLVFAWIIAMPLVHPDWTVNSLLRTMAVWFDIPIALWLAGLGWTAYRRRRSPRR